MTGEQLEKLYTKTHYQEVATRAIADRRQNRSGGRRVEDSSGSGSCCPECFATLGLDHEMPCVVNL